MELNGALVDVTLAGEKGRGALLLHGWGCSAALMKGPQTLLSQTMRTAAVDFPGHGHEGKALPPPSTWGVPEYGEMIVQLIRQLELAPCDIVAHSFGGRVAIWLAANHPELVGRMVLTGAAGIPKLKTNQATFRSKLYQNLKGAVNLADKTGLFGDLPDKGREALIRRFGSADYKALSPEMRQTFNRVIGLDLTDCLPKIKAETLLFWGADDTETPLWMGKKMEELIPDAGLVVEAGTGHFAYLERSAVFAGVLRSFLMEDR